MQILSSAQFRAIRALTLRARPADKHSNRPKLKMALLGTHALMLVNNMGPETDNACKRLDPIRDTETTDQVWSSFLGLTWSIGHQFS